MMSRRREQNFNPLAPARELLVAVLPCILTIVSVSVAGAWAMRQIMGPAESEASKVLRLAGAFCAGGLPAGLLHMFVWRKLRAKSAMPPGDSGSILRESTLRDLPWALASVFLFCGGAALAVLLANLGAHLLRLELSPFMLVAAPMLAGGLCGEAVFLRILRRRDDR